MRRLIGTESGDVLYRQGPSPVDDGCVGKSLRRNSSGLDSAGLDLNGHVGDGDLSLPDVVVDGCAEPFGQ